MGEQSASATVRASRWHQPLHGGAGQQGSDGERSDGYVPGRSHQGVEDDGKEGSVEAEDWRQAGKNGKG